MPQTIKALDSLLSRALRTETIMSIVFVVLTALGELQGDEAIGGGAVVVALALGRSFVKANGHSDAPDA